MAKTKLKPPKAGIESVTETDRGVEVMFKGVRLIYDGISEVIESEFEGVPSYNFKAGLEIPGGPALDQLRKTIRTKFLKHQAKGWAGKIGVAHFDEKKFQNAQESGFRVLYPTSPAVETEDGGYQAKGKLFVNPSHDKFYAGCYVDAKVAFVANTRGAITVKDYLNGIKFVADGEPISGASDPWKDSESKQTVKGKRDAVKAEKGGGKKAPSKRKK